ncbi:MAG TPA: 50S ribosomal protein L32 [Pseudoxanthomonas sp.]
MKLTLRPYQDRGRADLRGCYRSKKRAPLYVLPTGGGKTVTYAAVAEGAAALGNRVLILEHRKELIRQASLAVGGVGVPHQVIAPKEKVAGIRRAHVDRLGWPMIDPSAHVAVASVQTLAVRMDWLAEFDPDLIVIDEAHHAVAGTWKRIIDACPRARLLGVTATPCRTNGQGLGDVFDAMVLGPTMRELIADGYLLPPRVVAPPTQIDLSAVHTSGGDYRAEELAAAMDKATITGDAVEHYGRLAPGRPTIVFCANLAHAEHVAEEFRRAGWRFEVIHGNLEDTERDGLIFGLADGTYHGLVSVNVVSEGTDIPVAEVAILLRPTQSESLFLQQVGRVLRPVYADGFDLSSLEGRLAAIAGSGKPHGLVIDHVGNCGRWINGQFVRNHGLPHDDRDWSLAGRKKRKRAANDNEEVVSIQQCPECYAVHDPAPACPACGFTYKARPQPLPEKVDGQLREVTEDAAASAQDARRAQGQARTVEALVATGMNEKRARHVIEAREEKARLQQQVKDLLTRWFDAAGRPQPAARAVFDAFGFHSTEVMRMKPKALREAVERVTEELLRLQLGAPANDNGFSIRSSA